MYVVNITATLIVIDAFAKPDWNIKKLVIHNGAAILFIQGLNLPSFVGATLSISVPIPISVKASINLATKNNKPTIIGAKKSNGSMHFVIVKGFLASNSITKSSFIINDPGSNTRTTLSEFMNVYPNFYKIAYYN